MIELEEFGFSIRIVNILIRNKISKERLISITYEELIGLKNMDTDKPDELQKTLESKGYFNIKFLVCDMLLKMSNKSTRINVQGHVEKFKRLVILKIQ